MNLNTMSIEQIKTEGAARSIRASQLQSLYLNSLNLLGKEHDATRALWSEYIAADEAAQPYRVKLGQIAMQEQIDAMDADEFATFRRLID